jgi:hypothetical protein
MLAMEFVYFRAIERLFIVGSGLVCIVLGYGLFRLSYVHDGRSNAELVAKGGGFELTLKHVWPGVFFAAFGMIVLVASILTQLRVPAAVNPEPGQGVTYQGGGTPPPDSRLRAISAIAAIGQVLAAESGGVAASGLQRETSMARLATAQIDLVDVAYGQGSYEKFLDIASKSKVPHDYAALPDSDKQFFEDLRTALQK